MTATIGDRDRRLLITIFYEGPWARLERICLGVRKGDELDLRWEIPLNPTGWRRWLEEAADWANRRDVAWIQRYASQGKNPPRRWRRR